MAASVTDPLEHGLAISLAEPSDDIVVVSLGGELDVSTTAELVTCLAGLGGRARVVVDVSGLSFIDSSGLNALVVAARAAEARGLTMVLAGSTDHIARVFEVVHIAESIAVEPTVEAALERIGTES